MVRRVTLFGVLTVALSCVGVGALIGLASASARCENNHVAYHGQFFFEITATKLRKISCKEALKIGKPLYHAKITLPAKYFPPPSAGVSGVPGGQGKSFGLSTPAGHFTCHITIRLSDTIAADCHRGKHSANVNVHRDCCNNARDLGRATQREPESRSPWWASARDAGWDRPKSQGSRVLVFDESQASDPRALRRLGASRIGESARTHERQAERDWCDRVVAQGEARASQPHR